MQTGFLNYVYSRKLWECNSHCVFFMAYFPARFVSLLRSVLSRDLPNLYWNDAGDVFYIRQPHGIMDEHFNGIQYTSFVRQLHMYGFRNMRVEYEFGGSAFSHASFTRDKPLNDVYIQRKRQAGVPAAPSTKRRTASKMGATPKSSRCPSLLMSITAATPTPTLTQMSSLSADAAADADSAATGSNKRARTEMDTITSMLDNLKANVVKLEGIVHDVLIDAAVRNAQFAALEADLNSLPTRGVALGLKWEF